MMEKLLQLKSSAEQASNRANYGSNRSNEASHAKDGGKLGPNGRGPYEVKESLGKGAYKLKDRKGNDMPRTWNICMIVRDGVSAQGTVEDEQRSGRFAKGPGQQKTILDLIHSRFILDFNK
ncbi:hypothetical protein Tco_0740795 [Tanacetum coccineum]